jgi:thiamine transporter ThiT
MVSTWHIKEKKLNKISLIRFFVHCLNGIVFTSLFAYTHSLLFSFTAHLAYNLTILARSPVTKPFYTHKSSQSKE